MRTPPKLVRRLVVAPLVLAVEAVLVLLSPLILLLALVASPVFGGLRPLRAALGDLVDELAPVAQRLGCEDELRSALAMADEGPSYLRQRAIVERGGSLVDVVDALVEELRTDRPSVRPAPPERPASEELEPRATPR